MEKKKHVKKRKSIIVNWIVTSCAILVIPMFFNFLIYAFSKNAVQTEAKRAEIENLNLIKQIVDSKIQAFHTISAELLENSSINLIAAQDRRLAELDRYDYIYPINMMIGKYMHTNESMTKMYIVFHSGQVLTNNGQLSFEEFCSDIKTDMDTADLRNVVLGRGRHRMIATDKSLEGNAGKVMYIAPISYGEFLAPNAAVVILADTQTLFQLNDAHHASLVVSDQGNIISWQAGENVTADLKKIDVNTDFSVTQGNMISSIPSDVSGWKYTKVMAAEVYLREVNKINLLAMLGFMICIMIEAWFVVFFNKRNYIPVKEIMEVINSNFKGNQDYAENEYAAIKNTILDTYTEKERQGKRLERNFALFRKDYIVKLLNGNSHSKQPIENFLSEFGIQFYSDSFGVMIVHVDRMDGILEWKNITEARARELLLFLIPNVVDDLMNDTDIVYYTEYDCYIVFLVNLRHTKAEKGVAKMHLVAKRLEEFFKSEFEVMLTIAISQIHEGVSALPSAFSEALETMEYRFVSGENSILKYEALLKNEEFLSKKYYYPISVEQQLIGKIKQGDLSSSIEIIRDIFKKNFDDMSLSILMARCLTYDILSTIIKAFDDVSEIHNIDFENMLTYVNNIATSQTYMHYQKNLEDALSNVCGYIKKNHVETKINIRDIICYIDENLCNEELNISAIGLQFKITPYYLSKIFRQHMGISILDYLRNKRIEVAKHKLADTDKSVFEIAREVGYFDRNTFTRTFKKVTGVSPGQFKELTNQKTGRSDA